MHVMHSITGRKPGGIHIKPVTSREVFTLESPTPQVIRWASKYANDLSKSSHGTGGEDRQAGHVPAKNGKETLETAIKWFKGRPVKTELPNGPSYIDIACGEFRDTVVIEGVKQRVFCWLPKGHGEGRLAHYGKQHVAGLGNYYF